MNTVALETAVRQTLLSLLPEQGIELPVVTGNQPKKQGRVDAGVYFFVVTRGKRGWQGRRLVVEDDKRITEETQNNESLYQFQAFVEDAGGDQLLADDVLAIVRGIIQSNRFTGAMSKAGIGVQRPTEIRVPFFVNDKDQYEANPSFDVVFSHKRTIRQTTDVVKRIEGNFSRV